MGVRHRNFTWGWLSRNAQENDTVLHSANFAYLPEIAGGDSMYLIMGVDDGFTISRDGAPEIVKVTAHAAGATSATVVRQAQRALGGGRRTARTRDRPTGRPRRCNGARRPRPPRSCRARATTGSWRWPAARPPIPARATSGSTRRRRRCGCATGRASGPAWRSPRASSARRAATGADVLYSGRVPDERSANTKFATSDWAAELDLNLPPNTTWASYSLIEIAAAHRSNRGGTNSILLFPDQTPSNGGTGPQIARVPRGAADG